ncbi:MAG: NADH-quinone oxidoreductase subunit NuoH [Bacteriovoracaceae bacterium]
MNDTIASYFTDLGALEALNSVLPSALQISPLVFTITIFLIGCGAVVGALATVGGLGTYAERKISADIQMRQGPNRVGPYGLLQFLADGVKMIMKEDIIPTQADRGMFIIAPVLCMVGIMATLVIVPFSSGLTLSSLNVGVIYLLGVGSLIGIGILLGGYASNSKWSMLGGMRGASQIISYEVPVTLSMLAIVVLGGSLNFNVIIEQQSALPHNWFIFHNPFTFIGFFVFFIGALAEANRAPFDLPEAESELVSGYHTEYTGMRFGLFALAEYIEVFVLGGIAVALFLGGYKMPFDATAFLIKNFSMPEALASHVQQFLEVGCFVTKTLLIYYVVIWIRWTLPRLRVDQLMTICWKYLTPIALVNLIGCAVWMVAFDGQSMFDLFASIFSGGYGGGH